MLLSQMSIKKIVSLFLLAVVASSACVNLTQLDGRCTRCQGPETVVNGRCYPKIRGCLTYVEGPVCIGCQSGYVLNLITCTRWAEYYNLTENTTQIPAGLIEVQKNMFKNTLTLADIRDRFSEQYGSWAKTAHDYFIKKYSQLGRAAVRNVDKLQTIKGVAVSIDYQISSAMKYQAVDFVNNNAVVEEWYFSAAPIVKTDPIVANIQIRTALADKIKDYSTYTVKKDNQTYIFDYIKISINKTYDIVRVSVNRSDLLNTVNFGSKISVKNLTLGDLGKEEVLAKYPSLKNTKLSIPQQFDDTYVLYFGNSSISYRFNISQMFVINEPIIVQQPVSSLPSSGSPITITGGFRENSNYSDTWLLETIQQIARQFPEMVGSMIKKVQEQVVAGKNYIINFATKDGSEYEFRAYHALDGKIEITEGKKNSKVIYSKKYNYNLDPTFLTNYKIVESQSRVLPIQPINSVEFKLSSKRYYKINYSEKQFAEFEVNPDNGIATLLSYTVDQENIYLTLASARIKSQKRSNETLLAFIRSKQLLSNNTVIRQVVLNGTTYNVTLVSSLGTHLAIVQDKGELILREYKLLSVATCYTLSTFQAIDNDNVAFINSYIKSNYSIMTNFQLQLVQINFANSAATYRLLYADPNLKQVQFYVDERNQQKTIAKALYLNFAMEMISDVQSSDYQRIIAYLKALASAGSQLPFYVESNSTTIKGYYEDDKSLFQITIDKKSDTKSIQTLSTRSYVLVPDYFSLPTLLVPGNFSQSDKVILDKIGVEVAKKYSVLFANSTIVYASRSGSNYTLMYNTSAGYIRVDAIYDVFGTVVVGKASITAYKTSDLSNCQKFSVSGQCLSCDLNTQIEYQGSCFGKLPGCLIQAGDYCIKCDASSSRSNYKCFQECSTYFK